TLKFREIRGIEGVIRNLITLGVAITWLIIALSARWLFDFSWEISFLFGAVMVVTGPTVIAPLLRTVRPKENLANILHWESILIDPIGATLAVLVYQFIIVDAAQDEFLVTFVVFAKIVAIGLAFGASTGFLFGIALRRHWVPQYLKNFTALAIVCGAFSLSDTLEAESGLLTVTVMGIFLANMKDVNLDEILDFKESLSIVLISMLFILLPARMNMDDFLGLGWSAVILFAIIQFISRPIAAHISAVGSKLSMSERHLLSWIAPRGIVAAAISSLFAFRLESQGYEEATLMVPLAFMIIISTVLLQSLSSALIAKWLGVAEPEPKGFLIIGGGPLERTIAEALQENGFKTLLADQSWENIKTANMQGLQTYWGSVVSVHADRHLSLSGIGKLLALTSNPDLNTLSAKHYRMEFGDENIYVIRNQQTEQTTKTKSSIQHGGKFLFQKGLTRDALTTFLSKGAKIKTTLLTDEFSYEDYQQQNKRARIPLFFIDPSDKIYTTTSKDDITPKTDWKVISFILDQPANLPQDGDLAGQE
ncbi:MAG: cation:proton antiporter, partial [Bacteriovoracaceae bacterium]